MVVTSLLSSRKVMVQGHPRWSFPMPLPHRMMQTGAGKTQVHNLWDTVWARSVFGSVETNPARTLVHDP